MLAEPGADSGRLTLALASALLDDGDVAGAGRVLDAYRGPPGRRLAPARGPRRRPRAAVSTRRSPTLRRRVPTSLMRPSAAGDLFLEGMIADASGEPLRAAGLYQQAAADAVSDLERARFLLAAEQMRLRIGSVSDTQLEADQKNATTYQNQKIGYGFTREYAIALNSLGRRAQAIDVLQGGLRALPPEERSEADHFRLMLGLIAGAAEGVGRQELFELLEFRQRSRPPADRAPAPRAQLPVGGAAHGARRRRWTG